MNDSEETPEARTGDQGGSFANWLRWVGFVGIIAIAVLRCMVVFTPQVVFDVDPVGEQSVLSVLGPSGSMLLDVLLLGACGCALLGEWLSHREIDWRLLLLALIPVPIVLWHGADDGGNLWRGSTWAAAAIACAMLAHLVRDRTLRHVALALLVAVVIPLLARGAAQVTYEHTGNVQYYEQHKEQIWMARGWRPDSPEVRIYERRLRQAQPIAWFATSNIFASLVAFALVIWIGLARAAAHARLQSGWAGLMVLCAAAAAVGLGLTGSKGALLAVLIGTALGVAIDFGFWILDFGLFVGARGAQSKIQNSKSKMPSPGPMIIGCVLLTLAAVVVRGGLLPEALIGEKSLLFRWHYMVASARIFAANVLHGVGPDGFQAAYILHRLPRSPEEVASAHSMFIDWMCTLGISGASWAALVLLLLWRFGWSAGAGRDENRTSRTWISARRLAIGSTVAVAMLAFVPSLILEWPVLDATGLLIRLFGMIGFAIIAPMAVYVLDHADQRVVMAWLGAAIATLVMHGQIEMTFHQPGSVVWAMSAIALAGSARPAGRRTSNITAIAAIAAIAAVMIWLIANGVAPAWRQQAAMERAATLLQSLDESQRKDIDLIVKRRRAAAAELVEAYELWPADVKPLEAAAHQLELAALTMNPPPLGLLMQAQDLIERALREHGNPSSIAQAIGISQLLAQITGDREHWETAIAHARRMTELDPNGLGAWRRLGDLLWLSGDRASPAVAYQRALQCDANFALDESKRLTREERDELKRRIDDANKPPT